MQSSYIFFAFALSLSMNVGMARCVTNATVAGRKKRSLTFPKGSAFVLTMTFLKAIQIKEPSNWNLDLEFDMIWPIPEGLNYKLKKKLHKEPPAGYFRPDILLHHRRHRRELYSNFELVLESQGFPSNKCILRTICEANVFLSPPGHSLVEDILRVIFSYPSSLGSEYDIYDSASKTKSDCDVSYPCPISLLDLFLNYQNT